MATAAQKHAPFVGVDVVTPIMDGDGGDCNDIINELMKKYGFTKQKVINLFTESEGVTPQQAQNSNDEERDY